MRKAVVFILLLLFFVSPALTQAQTQTTVLTLSDEVYADLALRGYLNSVSLSYYNPERKESISVADTKHWLPASTVKLFAALYAFKKIEDHTLNLNDNIVVDAKNVVPTESVDNGLSIIQQGNIVTVDRLIRQMITQSDNTAFNILLDVLDRKAVTSYIQSLGLTHSSVGSKLNLDTTQTQFEFEDKGYGINTTTAQDYTLAFELILGNKIPGASTLLSILKQQKINYMIPLLLPKSALVAHKHGDLDPLYHDGGIVFSSSAGPYVLSIFSNVGDPNVVAHLSELIYTRDPKLVGAALQSSPPTTQAQPIDPLVAEGTFPSSNVLAAQSSPIPQTQLITGADLGITAQDLSLAKSSQELPKVTIPADSPFYFLVPLERTLRRASAISIKDKAEIETQSILLEVAQVKDLYKRGKTVQAANLIKNIQRDMNSAAKNPEVQNNVTAQLVLQTASETRFQLLGDNLKKATNDTQRNQIIKDIGQQAKTTVEQVQPHLPLATNATNITQNPLIGEVVSKNDSSLIIQTAGGQQITVPTDSKIIVKTKEIPQPATAERPSVSESAPTATPLSSIQVGTTVALIGSSVGNKFTPTFVLTNVAKELAAPEPVTVVKINSANKTMVISENGVPVQVNVGPNTIIKGADTSIGFTQIKEGDVVVVHGEPLKQVITETPTPAPPGTSTSSTSSSNPAQSSTAQPPGTQNSVQPTSSVSPAQGGRNSTTTTVPVQTQSKTTQTTSSPAKSTAPVQAAPATVQPKVIQSTSIQVVEKKESKASAPAAAPAPAAKPAPEAPKNQSQPAAPPATAAPSSKTEEKKK